MRAHRILLIVGGIAMVVGAIDPLEGSLVILLGSAMIALGHYLGKSESRILRYWVWVFILIAVGVGALWGLSALGGIGGSTGRSMWWGLVVLPYPIGWLLGVIGMILRAIRFPSAKGAGTDS